MPQATCNLDEKLVEKIIEDLSDRKCLKCAWEQFDDNLKKEIRKTCKKIILKHGLAIYAMKGFALKIAALIAGVRI